MTRRDKPLSYRLTALLHDIAFSCRVIPNCAHTYRPISKYTLYLEKRGFIRMKPTDGLFSRTIRLTPKGRLHTRWEMTAEGWDVVGKPQLATETRQREALERLGLTKVESA